MLRLLQWLLLGHVHEWKTTKTQVLLVDGTKERGERWFQECKTCGKAVKRDFL